MKASSATSAKATGAAPTVGPSSDRRPTPTSAEGFALSGPSDLPDPTTHAYRRDLADVALAGRVIASHFARPVERVLAMASILLSGPSDETEQVRRLDAGEPFSLLDDRLGWAWGYAGAERLVGYVPSEALTK